MVSRAVLGWGALGSVALGIAGFSMLSGIFSLGHSQKACSDATTALMKIQYRLTIEPEKVNEAEKKMLQVCGAAGAIGESYSKALPSK